MRLLPTLFTLLTLLACGTSAYKYVKPPLPIPAGKLDGLSPEEQALEAELQKVVSSPTCGPLFSNLVPKAIIVLTDFPGLTYTAYADAAGCRIERGSKPDIDYLLPVDSKNVQALLQIFEDGAVSDEEKYRAYYVTYLSGIVAGFRADAMYNEDVAKALALPPVVHMTLLNPNGYEYRGSKEPRKATATLENRVWVIKEGHIGTAGLKVETTVDKLEEQMKIVNGSPALSDLDRLNAFKAWLASVTVPLA